jgi:tetratricopeptide (TPR) repeat protein
MVLLVSFMLLGSGTGIASPPQRVEGLVNMRFLPDARVFAVMAAINAGGFDLDDQRMADNPVRKRVRERLNGMDPDLRGRLARFYSAHFGDQQLKYVSYALLLTGPPEFALTLTPDELPVEAAPLLGFETLVRELWAKGGAQRLWDEVGPAYAAEAESYRPLIRQMILETLRYLRTDPRVSLDRRVTFIPDLLNAFGVVNARNVGDDYFVVVGPSTKDSKLVASVRHEYLHFLLDPLVAKYHILLPDGAPFLKKLEGMQGAESPFKDNFALMLRESLIHAVEERLRKQEAAARSAAIVEDYDKGLILVPYFDERFADFETGSSSIVEAIGGMLKGVRWETESRRDETLQAMRQERRPEPGSVIEAPTASTASPSAIRTRLEQANKLLLARKFEEAEPLLREVLRLEPENASALFGLAQIATRRMQLQDALDLFGEAAARSQDSSWIAGWSLVYRGNIFAQSGDMARARAEWSKALELQGDLRGAREAASKALSETSPPPQ